MQVFTNCQLILEDEIISGTIAIADNGIIHDISTTGYSGSETEDMNGDYLMPGLIEMHTDNLEKNIQPRPGVIWPSTMAATIAHDTQIIGAGITTVYDALAVGAVQRSDLRMQILEGSVQAISRGVELELYKADHFIHLRCEIGNELMEEMLHKHQKCSLLGIISIMDHTPGQRQWRDIEKWRTFHRDKQWSEEKVEKILEELRLNQKKFAESNRAAALNFARKRNLVLASHDDTTVEDTMQSAENGMKICEFPTTLEAAMQSRKKGMKNIMGAPNVVRGSSHSGNVSASLLAENRLLDGLSSDYVPSSLIQAVFHLSEKLELPLNETTAMVSTNISEMVGLKDRGALRVGLIGDMIRVQKVEGIPVIKRVWKRGHTVC